MAVNTTQIIYKDLDIYGREDAYGAVQEPEGDAAISNALIAWFTSKIGDYIYQPNLGGVLDRSLFKLMNTAQVQALDSFLRSEIANNFGGIMNIANLTIDQKKETRILEITIIWVSLLTSKTNTVTFNTAPRREAVVKEFVDVPYIGENALNFVLVKLPELPGIPLTYDDIEGKWVWGSYRFTNLQNTDANFASLYNLTRS